MAHFKVGQRERVMILKTYSHSRVVGHHVVMDCQDGLAIRPEIQYDFGNWGWGGSRKIVWKNWSQNMLISPGKEFTEPKRLLKS